jgi:hypothetical protein
MDNTTKVMIGILIVIIAYFAFFRGNTSGTSDTLFSVLQASSEPQGTKITSELACNSVSDCVSTDESTENVRCDKVCIYYVTTFVKGG